MAAAGDWESGQGTSERVDIVTDGLGPFTVVAAGAPQENMRRSPPELLITEKDAVKCRANPVLASDGRLCVVPLAVSLDDGLVDLVERRLRARRPDSAPPVGAPAPSPTAAIEEQNGPSPA